MAFVVLVVSNTGQRNRSWPN